MTVFLGTLWRVIKEVKAPFMFNGEHRTALHAMQGNGASSHGEGQVSWIFLRCGRNLCYVLQLQRGWPFKTRVCSETSGLRSRCKGHHRILLEVQPGNRDASRSEAADPVSLSSCNRDIGIPINIQEELGSSPFEALNAVCLSSCQRMRGLLSR